jgi:hypothetical protein
MQGGSMMSTNPRAGRLARTALTGLIAVASAVLVLAFSGAHEGHAASDRGHADPLAASAQTSHKQAAFQDAMRKLWEDHITWTRLAIISFAHELPDLPATQDRLLRNQSDIGNAIKPYYGRAAGNQLTGLLEEHIAGAVALLQAAKAGDQGLIEQRTAEWYENGNQIADFLHEANQRNWPRKMMRRMMRRHLDQTISEAVNRLQGNYTADIRDYDEIHRHILVMADTLSSGIIKQFPRRFR